MNEPLLLVTFDEVSAAAATTNAAHPGTDEEDASIIQQLKRDLESTRAELRLSIEDRDTIKEEMQASDEEAIFVNEELQSSNEELESSKEELQSMNEELTTLNSQLNIKVEELARSNEDLDNLLNSTDIATLFLDNELRIRRFTPVTKQLFNLIASDVGRPYQDIRQKFTDVNLLRDAERVLQNLTPMEREILSESDRWYVRRILPYRSGSDRIGGVVLTFVDITTRKEAEQQSQLFATVVRDSNDAIVVLDPEGRIIAWNRGAQKMYGRTEREALAMNIVDLTPDAERDNTRALVSRVAAGEQIPSAQAFRLAKDGSHLDIWLTITALRDETGQVYRIATTERDVTALKRTR